MARRRNSGILAAFEENRHKQRRQRESEQRALLATEGDGARGAGGRPRPGPSTNARAAVSTRNTAKPTRPSEPPRCRPGHRSRRGPHRRPGLPAASARIVKLPVAVRRSTRAAGRSGAVPGSPRVRACRPRGVCTRWLRAPASSTNRTARPPAPGSTTTCGQPQRPSGAPAAPRRRAPPVPGWAAAERPPPHRAQPAGRRPAPAARMATPRRSRSTSPRCCDLSPPWPDDSRPSRKMCWDGAERQLVVNWELPGSRGRPAAEPDPLREVGRPRIRDQTPGRRTPRDLPAAAGPVRAARAVGDFRAPLPSPDGLPLVRSVAFNGPWCAPTPPPARTARRT